MSSRGSFEAPCCPPQEEQPPDPARKGLTNFHAAQKAQAIATPAATNDCQSIDLPPSQSHCALIGRKRADIGQYRHVGERQRRPCPGLRLPADDGQR